MLDGVSQAAAARRTPGQFLRLRPAAGRCRRLRYAVEHAQDGIVKLAPARSGTLTRYRRRQVLDTLVESAKDQCLPCDCRQWRDGLIQGSDEVSAVGVNERLLRIVELT